MNYTVGKLIVLLVIFSVSIMSIPVMADQRVTIKDPLRDAVAVVETICIGDLLFVVMLTHNDNRLVQVYRPAGVTISTGEDRRDDYRPQPVTCKK